MQHYYIEKYFLFIEMQLLFIVIVDYKILISN